MLNLSCYRDSRPGFLTGGRAAGTRPQQLSGLLPSKVRSAQSPLKRPSAPQGVTSLLKPVHLDSEPQYPPLGAPPPSCGSPTVPPLQFSFLRITALAPFSECASVLQGWLGRGSPSVSGRRSGTPLSTHSKLRHQSCSTGCGRPSPWGHPVLPRICPPCG